MTEETLDADSFRILQVQLGQSWRVTLHDALPAYQTEEGLYLPLVELMNSLDFAIALTPGGRGAKGWFLQPNREFALDSENCSVSAERSSKPLPAGSVLLQDQDIYVPESLLTRWFPLDFAFDPADLRLQVIPREPLPIERRLERQARWDRFGGARSEQEPDYPLEDVPYRYWDWPFVDASAESFWRHDSDGTDRLESRYKVVGTGDFLKLNTQLAISGNQDDPADDIFLRMGRSDPRGGLLGPLNAREFAFGDIGLPTDPLIATSALGHGIEISSFPLDRPQEFDRIDLQGELPLGWDVELYHNGALIAYQTGQDRYEFTDIPLRYGVNQLRLVFYGPQGQVRERVVQRVVGAEMARPGASFFHMAALWEDSDRATFGNAAEQRLLLNYQRGLNRYLAVGGSLQSLDFGNRRRDYGTLDLNLSLPGVFSRMRLASETEGGEAASLSLLSQLWGVSVAAETAHFFDFESERTLTGGPGSLESRSTLRFDGNLPRLGPLWTALGARLKHERWSGGDRNELMTQLSVSGTRGRLSHMLELNEVGVGDIETRYLLQRLFGSARIGPVYLRGEVTQQLQPEEYWNTAAVSADWRVNPRLTARFDVSSAIQTDVTQVGASMSWQLEQVALGGSLFGTSDGDYGVGVSVALSAARDPLGQRWATSSRPQSRTGAVAATVYLDDNGNGVRDPGEPTLPGIEVRGSRSSRGAITDNNGHAFLSGLPAYQEANLHIVAASLENPFWVPGGDGGLRLVPRPGRVAEVVLPVIPVGSIDGVVYQQRDSTRLPAAGVSLQLMNGNGEVVRRTRSGYDGYYNFEQVPPGRYLVQANDTERMANLAVTVQGQDPMVSAPDLVLGREPTPQIGAITRPRPSSEGWIMAQNAGNYTIQLIASSDEAAVQAFIREHELHESSGYFRSSRDDAPWYSVLYGSYATYDQAYSALRKLPPRLRATGPWIRPFGEVQALVEADRPLRQRPVPQQVADRPRPESEAEILAQDPRRYAIQLMAARQEETVQRFIQEHELDGRTAYFRSSYQGRPWYSLLYGNYPNFHEANQALRRLPPALREAGAWARPYGEVQVIIRNDMRRN